MGVIKRQSIKKSLVSYAGVAIGAVSTLFIYPLEEEALGLVRFLIATALLTLPLTTLGAKLLAVRFFPDFKDTNNGHNGYLGLLLSLLFIGFTLFCLLSFALQDSIYAFYAEKNKENSNPLLLQFLPYTLGFALLLALVEVLSAYISNFHRVVVPHIINNLLIKIALPVLILLFYFNYIDHKQLVHLFLIIYLLNVLLLVGYLAYLKELKIQLRFNYLTKSRARTMGTYALFGILGSVGSYLATQIDIFMAGSMINLKTTGVYSLALFFATTIEIPMQAMVSIISPIVAEAAKNNDYEEIGRLYQKSSITLFLAGAFIYCLIVLNLDYLLNLLPKGEVIRGGKLVIYILGAAKLFDLLTSINGYIINYSKYFRFSLYTLLFLGGLNIILNQAFIPIFHINGIALATFVSLVLYNSIKITYVYWRFKLLPFTTNTIRAILLALCCFGLAWIIPSTRFDLLNMVLKTAIFSVPFIGLALHWRIAPDINDLVQENLERFGIISK